MIEYNIEIREFNGTDYDVLYPKTKMENVDGLEDTIDEINSSIQAVDGKAEQNKSNINQLIIDVFGEIGRLDEKIDGIETDDGDMSETIADINSNISGLQQSISDLSENKQNKNELGNLAFENTVNLSSSNIVNGILSILNGGTGGETPSEALSNLGITISDIPIVEGDELPSGSIYIYYENNQE